MIKKYIKKIPLITRIYRQILQFKRFQVFKNEFNRFKSMDTEKRFDIQWEDRFPCLQNLDLLASFDFHYVYHTAWAARVLAEIMPKQHVDISSHIPFNAIVSAFIPIKFYDYNPVNLMLSNLESMQVDLLSLDFNDSSIESLSCMHVIEHIGLGRYGDPINPDGDLIAIKELKRVLAVDGNLLFVVPISGTPKIQFNAQRIYSYEQIINYFKEFVLIEFALIPDYPCTSGIIRHASQQMANEQTYGCGCFWFRK